MDVLRAESASGRAIAPGLGFGVEGLGDWVQGFVFIGRYRVYWEVPD
jgi:hypothetical protein